MTTQSQKEAKKERMKKWREANKDHVKEYSKKYVKNNAQQIAEQRKRWKEANPDYNKKRYKAQRKLIFLHYGQVCACCGEANLEFLTIDHIEGGGSKHREEIGPGLYAWLIKNKFPTGFRTLCWNCNLSLGAYGYCPHQVEGKKA